MFEELVKEIGGDKVDVKHVASPKFNIHFIQPKPGDVRNVANADLFVFTGLDLEA
jgi:ABC-type Zn uptake system ZnuABC Zn-binding protein ZnuA